MVIKAVFFDFDGTVSDARGIAEESLVRTLDDFGFSYNKRKALSLLGEKIEIILAALGSTSSNTGVPSENPRRAGKDLGIEAKMTRKVRNRFYRYFTGAAKEGKVSRCVSLKPLYEMKGKIPMIVVSNSRTSFLRASIKSLGIRGLFDKVIGAEKFVRKDDMLRKLFRKMKILPSEAVYVGDRFSDVEFAREAGCVAVAIHNKCSWSTLARIKREKPDYVIRDFRGLRKIIRGLAKK